MEGADSSITHLIVLCEQPCQVECYQSLLELTGLKTLLTASEAEFWATLEKHKVDLVLLGTSFPDPPAFPICMKLKAAGSPYRDLPVVVVFPEDTPPEVMLQALHLGAYDYLVEPVNEIALLTKITVLARIKQAEDEFRQLAITDVVTGLYDHRYLFLRANEELSRAKRYSRPLSLILLEVDQFEQIDQTYGPSSSNSVLQAIAGELKDLKRQIDVLARQGTCTFTLVLYNTDETGALVVANRILLKMRDLNCGLNGYRATLSIGQVSVETTPELTTHAQELLQQAAAAMRQASQSGGNRIVLYSDELAGSVIDI
jgi:two-component system, cell cycle response regulator